MKKVFISLILSMLALLTFSGNVSAYKISDEKENVIVSSLSPEIINTVENIVVKWDEQKTYTVYNKIKKLVFSLQMKVVTRTDISEEEKQKIIGKYNSVLYIIEKHVSDKYQSQSSEGDDI